ncbi:MAG: hypothetical protein IKO75_12415 [Bacteroidales bacterium]|nr:hypothetical protein [Bacteroidales bacterium]
MTRDDSSGCRLVPEARNPNNPILRSTPLRLCGVAEAVAWRHVGDTLLLATLWRVSDT